MVLSSQLCRPRIVSWIPSSSGRTTAAAPPPSRTGAAPVFPLLILREHAEPGFRQVAAGRRGDGVAAEVQARAQRGELAGNRAERGQGAALLQRRHHVTESAGDAGSALGRGAVP